MISVCFQGRPFNIIVIQVYGPITNAKKATVEQFYKDFQDILELLLLLLSHFSRVRFCATP